MSLAVPSSGSSPSGCCGPMSQQSRQLRRDVGVVARPLDYDESQGRTFQPLDRVRPCIGVEAVKVRLFADALDDFDVGDLRLLFEGCLKTQTYGAGTRTRHFIREHLAMRECEGARDAVQVLARWCERRRRGEGTLTDASWMSATQQPGFGGGIFLQIQGARNIRSCQRFGAGSPARRERQRCATGEKNWRSPSEHVEAFRRR